MKESIKRRLALVISIAMILTGSEMAPVNVMASSSDRLITEETDILNNEDPSSGLEEVINDEGDAEVIRDENGGEGIYPDDVTDDSDADLSVDRNGDVDGVKVIRAKKKQFRWRCILS